MDGGPTEGGADSGNVFADLGFSNANGMLAKAELARQIGGILAQRHLTRTDAARLLGTTRPKVSDLLRGRLAGFSLERLLRFLDALDPDVRIQVSVRPGNCPHAALRVDDATVDASTNLGARSP